MASASTASKPIQKILDSTRVASLKKFIQHPPIDPTKPIQGKIREPSSNAFKEHVKRESVRLQKALNSISHGKHIFAYHNVQTKQVVYSLTRYLEVSISCNITLIVTGYVVHSHGLLWFHQGSPIHPAIV